MSLQTRLQDFILGVGTDVKQLRTWISGSSTGDLTGLNTTTKTSLVAAVNEVNSKAPSAATESVSGVIQIATQVETTAGTDDTVAVSPLKLQVRLVDFAQPKSTNLTNLSGFTTSASGALLENSDVILPTQKAVKAYADSLLDANNAQVFKGGIDASTNPNYPAASAGHMYRITVAGRIGGAAGPVVEVNDTATCLVDATGAGSHAVVGANWLISQTNVDGAVIGPATSVAGHLATFSGTTGKLIQDSGIAVSTDGTMAAISNSLVPTEAAVRTYVASSAYNKTEIGNPEFDLVAAYNAARA